MKPAAAMRHWFLRGLGSGSGRPAVRVGKETRTYADLHETAIRWAWQLRHPERQRPARIGILTEQNETRYAGFLAALYSGATVIPLNPRWPPSRTRHALSAASANTVIVDEHHRNFDIGAGLPLRLFGPADQIAASAGSRTYLADEGSPDDIAYIIFTSGSTGEPKGVPVSHGNAGAFLASIGDRYDTGPTDVFSQLFDISFDLSIFEIFGAWGCGACVCPVSKLQAALPQRCVDEWGITVWTSTPSLATMLRNGDVLPPASLRRLRYSVFCGEPLPARTARYWMSAASSAFLDNLYGPTEAAVACTGFLVAPGSDLSDTGTVPIGWPFPGVDCLLGPSDGRTPPGDPGDPVQASGELWLTGPQVCGGYLNPGFDSERFASVGGRRWYKTGDQVRRTSEHGLVHLGRIDEQVKVNGYRVELAEVERAMERSAPGASCGAVIVSAPGELAILGAFVAGSDAGIAALRTNLAKELPPYMMPAHIWPVARLPVTPNGKTDRSALRDLGRRMLAGAQADCMLADCMLADC